MKLSNLERDPALEDEGQWITWPRHPEVRAFVRSPNFPPFRRAVAALEQRLAREAGRKNPVDPITREREFLKLEARHLWLGLEGLTDDDGDAIQWTPEFAAQIAADRRYRELSDFLDWAVTRVGDAEASALEEDAGN